MMCWVPFDRAIESVERFGLEGEIERWKALRAAIHDDICTHGFDQRRNSFVQDYDGTALDASLLLMPQLGFLPADDARVLGTIEAVRRDLTRDGFVMRYSTREVDDGVGGDEGAFLACSFWLADAEAMVGKLDDAVELFEKLLAVRNDLGLLAEEYCPANKRLLGNYPQGFSHIGLINTACNLVDARGPAQQRSQRTAPHEARTIGIALRAKYAPAGALLIFWVNAPASRRTLRVVRGRGAGLSPEVRSMLRFKQA